MGGEITKLRVNINNSRVTNRPINYYPALQQQVVTNFGK